MNFEFLKKTNVNGNQNRCENEYIFTYKDGEYTYVLILRRSSFTVFSRQKLIYSNRSMTMHSDLQWFRDVNYFGCQDE